MQSYYEINVSVCYINGRYVHFFATAPRSLTTEGEFREALEVFQEKFPAPDYRISAVHWRTEGECLKV